jgi:hypothetical protein
MAVKQWSKKQRAKFMATLAKRKASGGWGRGRKKPYRKPGRSNVTRSGNREGLIRIELV